MEISEVSEYGPGKTLEETIIQGSPLTVRVNRPSRDSAESAEELEEVLAVKLKLARAKLSAFNVFVNLPTAVEDTPITSAHYAGSFFHEARILKKPEQEYQETLFHLGLGDILAERGLLEQPDILVTFVPTGPNKHLPLTIADMHIRHE